MFLSFSHILILSENMLLNLNFEMFNQIRTENELTRINLLCYNKKQMLKAHVAYSVTHLLCVNVISSQ